MKLFLQNGKKFHDSGFHALAFQKIKKDETRARIVMNLLLLTLMLIAEYSIFLILCR